MPPVQTRYAGEHEPAWPNSFEPRRKMTDQEVMEALPTDTPLSRARQVFTSAAARIEQAGQQSPPPSPIEIRRMEFDAVRDIVAALGLAVLETWSA